MKNGIVMTNAELDELLGTPNRFDGHGHRIALDNDAIEAVLGPSGRRKPGRPKSAYKFWSEIDWSKPIQQIINETGKCFSSVYNWGKNFKPEEEKPEAKITDEDFRALSNVEIQSKYRFSYSYIVQLRRKRGIKMDRKGANHVGRMGTKKEEIVARTTVEDWKDFRDIDISRKYGVEREYIRQIRIESGVECEAEISNNPKIQAALDATIANLDMAKGMTTIKFAEKYGLTYSQAGLVARRLGFKFAVHAGKFAHYNFNLGSSMLARIHGARIISVEIYRKRNGIAGAKWNACWSINNPEFRSAVEAELKKAGSKQTVDQILAKTKNQACLKAKSKWELKNQKTTR